MAQQGKRSPRIFLVDSPAPSGAAASAAVVVPDETSIAVGLTGVNGTSGQVLTAQSNRDLTARPLASSLDRHTVEVPPADSDVTQFRSPVTARRGALDRHSIVAISATSAPDSINPQYRGHGCARGGGVYLPSNARGFLGCAAEIGVDMPLQFAVADSPRPVAGADPGADAAIVRPMTGVDAA